MSNYPPGVTGNEWQIAGPMDEYDSTKAIRVEEFCASAPEGILDVEGTVTVWNREEADFDWECQYCRGTHTIPINELED